MVTTMLPRSADRKLRIAMSEAPSHPTAPAGRGATHSPTGSQLVVALIFADPSTVPLRGPNKGNAEPATVQQLVHAAERGRGKRRRDSVEAGRSRLVLAALRDVRPGSTIEVKLTLASLVAEDRVEQCPASWLRAGRSGQLTNPCPAAEGKPCQSHLAHGSISGLSPRG